MLAIPEMGVPKDMPSMTPSAASEAVAGCSLVDARSAFPVALTGVGTWGMRVKGADPDPNSGGVGYGMTAQGSVYQLQKQSAWLVSVPCQVEPNPLPLLCNQLLPQQAG